MDRQKTHWDELSMHEKAKYIKLALDNGVSDLSMVRDSFNVYVGGGSINIKPENRGKFTELKERTGKSSTWYKEHGTPAQKKMATFALNAKKWAHKHEGTESDSKLHTLKVDTEYTTSQYNKALQEAEVLGFKGSNAANYALNKISNNMQYETSLPEVTVTAAKPKNIRYIKDSNTGNRVTYNDYQARQSTGTGYDKLGNVVGGAIALPMMTTLGVPIALQSLSEIASLDNMVRLAYPKVSKTLDALFTIDGARNLLSDNGVQKTYKLAQEGKYGRSVISGVGDIFDMLGTYNLIKPVSQYAKTIKTLGKDFINADNPMQVIDAIIEGRYVPFMSRKNMRDYIQESRKIAEQAKLDWKKGNGLVLNYSNANDIRNTDWYINYLPVNIKTKAKEGEIGAFDSDKPLIELRLRDYGQPNIVRPLHLNKNQSPVGQMQSVAGTMKHETQHAVQFALPRYFGWEIPHKYIDFSKGEPYYYNVVNPTSEFGKLFPEYNRAAMSFWEGSPAELNSEIRNILYEYDIPEYPTLWNKHQEDLLREFLNFRFKSLKKLGVTDVVDLARKTLEQGYANGGYLQNLTSKPFSYKPIPSVRYDLGGFIRNLFGLNDEINNKTDLIDMGELANRQAYAESGFTSDKTSRADARGMFQIVPAVLDDFNRVNGTTYDASQLYDDAINTDVRNWYLQENLMNRPWVNKEGQNDSIRVAKALAAYNYGPGNTLSTLNKAKGKGVDIYNGWDWLNAFPKETQDYVNFILRNQNNSLHRNNVLYELSKGKNKDKVKTISKKSK